MTRSAVLHEILWPLARPWSSQACVPLERGPAKKNPPVQVYPDENHKRRVHHFPLPSSHQSASQFPGVEIEPFCISVSLFLGAHWPYFNASAPTFFLSLHWPVSRPRRPTPPPYCRLASNSSSKNMCKKPRFP